MSAHHYKRGSTGDYAKPPNLDDDSLLNFTSNSVNDTAIDISIKGAFQFGGNAVTQVAQTVKDEVGNSYVTGGFTGSITLGTTTLTSSNGYDMYVAKLDANQQYVWARMAAGSSTVAEHFSLDGGTSLAVDQVGNVYVGGTFVKSLSFLDTNGQPLQQLTDGRSDTNLNMELFVVKYSPTGQLLWAVGGNSQSTGAPNSLAVDRNFVNSVILDSQGHPYIAGAYSGSSFLGETTDLAGKSDFILASLDKDGSDPFWISTTGTPEDDYATSISVDTLGYLNVLGVIGSGIMELPGGNTTWDNDTGANDTFVISYDVNGDWYFANFIGGGDQAIGNDVATSENGDFFVTGMFNDDLRFPRGENQDDIVLRANGAPEGFVAKYNLQGDILWAKQFGGGGAMYAHKVTTDTNGNVFVLGRYDNSVVFESASTTPTMLTTNSANDAFIAKYANDGRFLWAKQIESTGSQSIDRVARGDAQPMITQPLDLAYTPANGGELLLSGDFDGTLTLDTVVLTATANTQSSFVASYNVQADADLPVELIAFTAITDGDRAHLAWQTATETNNAGFQIEHSAANSAGWNPLSFTPGYGTTLDAQRYSYTTTGLAPGQHRFRLKQLDYDGAFAYSPEVEVSVAITSAFRLSEVYPNPFNPEASVTLSVHERQAVTVTVHDLLGREVSRLYEGEMAAQQGQTLRVDGTGWPSGLYVVRAVGEHFTASQTVTLLK